MTPAERAPQPSPSERALAHVSGLAHGRPLDPAWRTTLHFHPDRDVGTGSVLRSLAEDGRYRSQFETGTSNGGLTAHPGGDRWTWESRLFGGAYDVAAAADRPVYGALNHRRRRAGGAVRFGSAHLRLAPRTLPRTTFCYPDSVFEPVDVGTADACHLTDLADSGHLDPLDDYVEAHVHGGVVLPADVEALVLDPCYRGTPVEEEAHLLGVPVEHHHGFGLTVEELAAHGAYRGPGVVAAGTALARRGVLDARAVGDAARAGLADPQTLKLVWHCVARYGRPTARGTAGAPA